MKRCSKCKIEKPEEEYKKEARVKNGLCASCKECCRKHRKNYYENNKEKTLLRNKEYRKNNKEKLSLINEIYRENNKEKIKEWHNNNKEKRREYHRNRKINDLNFKIAHNLRNRLGYAIKSKQKVGSAVRDLGCSIDKFILWIEWHWTEGMSWDNYGKWEFDHIKPLSKFNLENRDELLEACHFTNIQPLWKIDNATKGNTIQ